MLTNLLCNSNKADLRILRSIHKQLGIQSPDALLSASRQKQQQERSALLYGGGTEAVNGDGKDRTNKSRTRKPAYHEVRARAQRNLRVFTTVLRAAARMRVDARRWAGHEKTRLKLVRALEESRRAAAEEEEQAVVVV